jgi:hypothetical protein
MTRVQLATLGLTIATTLCVASGALGQGAADPPPSAAPGAPSALPSVGTVSPPSSPPSDTPSLPSSGTMPQDPDAQAPDADGVSAPDAGAAVPEPPPPVATPAPAPVEPVAPPAPVPTPATAPVATSTPGDLNTPPPEKKESEHDKGLGLEWFWIDGHVGFAYSDLGSISSAQHGLTFASSTGPAVDFGAGIRLFALGLGVRVRDLALSAGNIVEVDGEAIVHTRIDHADFAFGLRGGYLTSGDLNMGTVTDTTGTTSASASAHGGNIGLVVGFDHYFSHYVSIGAEANPEFTFIQRPPLPLPNTPTLPSGVTCPSPIAMVQTQICTPYTTAVASYNALKANPLYKESGSSAGFGFMGALHVAVHF